MILPPLKPDNPNNGVQSDHHGILLKPKMQKMGHIKNVKLVRPFPESSIFAFGQEFVHKSWDFLNTYSDTTDMVKMFEDSMSVLVDKYCLSPEAKATALG